MKKILGLFFGAVIGCFGLVFSACTPDYSNVKIEAVLPSSAVENTMQFAVGEEQKFNLKISNAPSDFENQVSLNNVMDLFTVTNCEQENDTIYYTIKGLKSGKTTVNVLSYEGTKSCSFSVEVFDQVEGFSLNTTPYVVLESGKSYVLKNQSYFSYTPQNCKVPEIKYTYNGTEVSEIRIVEKEDEELCAKLVETNGTFLQSGEQDIEFSYGEISLTAEVLEYNSTLPNSDISSKNFKVQIVPQIETGNLKIVRKGADINTASKYITPDTEKIVEDGEIITLIQNKINECYLVFEVECFTADTQLKVSSDFCECTPISAGDTSELGDYVSTYENSKFFGVKALNVGEGKVKFEISYSSTQNEVYAKTGYTKTFEFDVKVIRTPYQMFVNDQTSFETPVLLYDNAQSEYNVYISVLDQLSVFESVSVEIGTKKDGKFEKFEDSEKYKNFYITYKNTNRIMENFEIAYADFSNNTLVSPIKIKATNKEIPSNLCLIFTINPVKVNGVAVETEKIQVGLPFELEEGVKSFTLNEKYTEEIAGQTVAKMLYLDADEEEYIFDGFEIKNIATARLGNFEFEYSEDAENYFEVTQVIEDGALTKKIKITPKQVGEGTVRVIAQEGFFQDLTFSVCKKLESATLGFVDDDSITASTLTNNSVSSLEIAYKANSYINFSVIKDNASANLYTISTSVDNTSVCCVETIKDTNFSLKIVSASNEKAILTTTIKKWKINDDFQREVVEDEDIVFETSIEVYSPIASVYFTEVTTDAETLVEAETQGVSVYRKSDIGARYASMAKSICKIYVTLKNGEIIEDVFRVYSDALIYKTSYGDLNDNGSSYGINKFGTLTEEGTNTLNFYCNADSASTGAFSFTVSINDHNVTYTAQLNITVNEFTPLEYIGISNYQETVYLSGKNTSFTFFTFMNANADIQEFEVKYEASDQKYDGLFDVSVSSDYSQVTISHNNSVARGSGYLYFIPRTMFDEDNNFRKDKVQKVEVIYSDGQDKNLPELISTADEFISAFSKQTTTEKHYVIMSTIDLGGYDLSVIRNLNGSLSGGNASAKIVNVALTLPSEITETKYVGLFPVINANSEINDITIEGSITGNVTSLGRNNTLSVGLVCGKNLGTLNNVSVVLNESSIEVCKTTKDTQTDNQIYVGGVVGQNNGTINNGVDVVTSKQNAQGEQKLIMFNFDDTKTNLVTVQTSSSFSVMYNGASTKNAVGGIAGVNTGKIFRATNDIKVYNQSNYTSNITLTTSGIEKTGGIAGENTSTGEIENQTIKGSITSQTKNLTQGGKNLGGVAGENAGKIQGCTFKASLLGQDFVGGLVGYETNPQNLKNNTVQAPRTAKITSIITAIFENGNVGAFLGNETSASFENVNNTLKTYGNCAKVYYEVNEANGECPIAYNYTAYEFKNFKTSAFEQATDSIEIVDINTSSTVFGFDEVTGVDANKIANMFFFEADDEQEQNYISSYNSNREIPFVFANPSNIIITSLNPEILSVDNFGVITLHKIGLATLQITSELDNLVFEKVYVFVTNAFNSLEIKNMNGEKIASNSFLLVSNNKPASLQYDFVYDDIITQDEYGQPLTVELKSADVPTVSVQYVTKAEYIALFGGSSTSADTLKINEVGSTLFTRAEQYGKQVVFTLIAQNVDDGYDYVCFYPKYEINLSEIGVSANITDFATLLSDDGCFGLIVDPIIGSKSVNLNFSQADIQPLDELCVSIVQSSDDKDDDLELVFTKLTDQTGVKKEYFVVLNKQKTEIYENEVFVGYKYNYTIKYNCEDEDFQSNYAGQYYITFIANNGTSSAILVNVQTQQLSSITSKNFFSVGLEFDCAQEESNQVASGTNNILELDVYPYFAEYEKIIIKNDQSNYSKNNILIMEFVELEDDGTFTYLDGVTYTTEGAIVAKSTIMNSAKINSTLAKLYVRYTTVTQATVGTTAKISIQAIKSSGEVAYEAVVALNIVMEDAVTFSIDARSSNSETTKYYVAKGLSYDLTLTLNGFTESQLQKNITHNGIETDCVQIEKINGKYKLIISDDITYPSGAEGYEVTISSYGENKEKGYKSAISTLEIVIVDYVILTDNISKFQYGVESIDDYSGSTVIGGANGAVVGLPVGSIYTLSNDLVYGQTIEYNQENYLTVQSVKNFKQSLTDVGEWLITVTDANLGVLDSFVSSMKLPSATTITTNYLKISNNTITPLRINSSASPYYYFTYSANCYYKEGGIIVTQESPLNCIDLSTNFLFEAYSNSTFENALPITSYNDLINMQAQAHYILLEDLTLPADFVPLTTEVASLNGNGHTITLPSTLSFEEGESFGLFATVGENTVLKNITLKVQTSTNITLSQTSNVYFGLIAGTNEGVITNCCVEGSQTSTITVILPNQNTDNTNYVAGLVGLNTGYITNSHVSINFTAVANVAGFVGVNNGKIASSYVRDSRIVNKGSGSHKTAGFAIKNGSSTSTNAKIITSYVCGTTNISGKNYSASTVYAIESSPTASGFVYNNFNDIEDCYSDIYINSSSNCAGFVYSNEGNVSRSYTTSTFGVLAGQSAYIFCDDTIEANTTGTFNDCYYLVGSANAKAKKHALKGLTELNESEFANKTIFENFSFSSNINKTEAIWFYPSKSQESEFVKNGQNLTFTYGKPELVAPNVLASTQMELDSQNTTTDSETGETIYAYRETLNAVGSYLNPILITSASNLESYILANSYKNVNSLNYRIIADIDYRNEEVAQSSLYQITLTGYIEGNGMEIAGYTINTRTTLKQAGLFGQLGRASSTVGTIANLEISPYYINLPNASCVGALLGKLEGGKLFNIACDGFRYTTSDALVAVGKNAVGGVVGFAENSFVMQNISSSISANATYSYIKSQQDFRIFESNSDLNYVSYSGAVVGITNAKGTMKNISITDACVSIGEVSGLVCGMIGKDVTLTQSNFEVNDENVVRASVYGGLVCGHVVGSVMNTTVQGTAQTNVFASVGTQSSSAIAVGGIAGLMVGGTISSCVVETSLEWSENAPNIIGGIVGECLGGEIISTNFAGSKITAVASNSNYNITEFVVGGIVGKVSPELSLQTASSPQQTNLTLEEINVFNSNNTFENVKVTGTISVSLVNVSNVYVGGVIGMAVHAYSTDDMDSITHNVSSHRVYTLNEVNNTMNISITNIIYGSLQKTYVGGLVGAVFSDENKQYAGEIVVYDTGDNASLSKGKISVKVYDNKSSAEVMVYAGGILGYGYSVDSQTQFNAKNYNEKSNPWGKLLQSAIEVEKAKGEDGTITHPTFASDYLNITVSSPLKANMGYTLISND